MADGDRQIVARDGSRLLAADGSIMLQQAGAGACRGSNLCDCCGATLPYTVLVTFSGITSCPCRDDGYPNWYVAEEHLSLINRTFELSRAGQCARTLYLQDYLIIKSCGSPGGGPCDISIHFGLCYSQSLGYGVGTWMGKTGSSGDCFIARDVHLPGGDCAALDGLAYANQLTCGDSGLFMCHGGTCTVQFP